MTDGDPIDTPTLATDCEMDAWAAAGRRDQGGLEVMWHAQHARRSCWTEKDCPFGDEAPKARQRWLDYFRVFVKAEHQRRQKELAAEAEPDKKRQWWHDM